MREEEQHCGTEKGDEGCTLAARDIAVQRTHGCINASTEPRLGGRRLRLVSKPLFLTILWR